MSSNKTPSDNSGLKSAFIFSEEKMPFDHAALLQKAKTVLSDIPQEVIKNSGSTARKQSATLGNLVALYSDLLGKNGEDFMLEAEAHLKPRKPFATLEEAKTAVGLTIETTLGEARSGILKNVTDQKRAAIATAERAAEEATEKPGFISRKFFNTAENFDNYLAKKTTSAKLGIGVSGIVLGGILLNSGGKWLSQGLEGKEPQYARIADGSTLVTTKPMNPTKRTAEILGGTIAGATGIAAELAGFFALYKCFTM